jgi:hypothetical protein
LIAKRGICWRLNKDKPNSLELKPKENLWEEIREKILKNYALKSIDAVRAKLSRRSSISIAIPKP